jgi:putative tricarboxylic transport membrane protein
MTRVTRRHALLGATGALAAATVLRPFSAAADFSGKTIRLIVGFGPGGTDTAARLFARYAEKYLPGKPTVIVENMPGAGTLLAQNFVFEKARPDGLTLGFNPFQFMAQLTRAPGPRFKYEKFTFIGGVTSAPFLTYARKDVIPGGLKQSADIMKAAKLRFAGREPIHGIDAITTLGADLMGLKYRYVPGYRADAKVTVAMRQGETNITGSGASGWKQFAEQMFKAGEVLPLWSHAYRDSSGKFVDPPIYAGTMPMFQDVYKAVHGKAPAGKLWDAYLFVTGLQNAASFIIAAPPGVDAKTAEMLREGFHKASADPGLRAETAKINGYEYGFVTLKEATAALDSLRKADDATVAFWTERFARQRSG